MKKTIFKLIKMIVVQSLPVLLDIIKSHFVKKPTEPEECNGFGEPLRGPLKKPELKYCKPLTHWGKCVTQKYANHDPVSYPKTGHHIGVDHASPLGTHVCAPADGEIVQSECWGTMGNFVVCRYAPNRWLVAAHLKDTVPTGLVHRGDVIGIVGNTGFTQGVHSHIEIWCKPPTPKREILPPDFATNWRDYLVDPLKEFK